MAATEGSSGKNHQFDHLADDELVTLIKSIRVFNNEDCSFIGLFNYEKGRDPNRKEMLDYLDKEKIYQNYLCDSDPKQHLLGGNPGCTNCDDYNEFRDFEPEYDIDSPEKCELHFKNERIRREIEEQRKVEEEQRKVKEEEQRKREEEQRKREEEEEEERVANIKVETLRRGHCPVEADTVDELIIGKCGHGISKEGREGMLKQANKDPIMRGNVDNCPECGQKNAFRGNTETHLTSQGKEKRAKRARIIELCKKGVLTAAACAAAAVAAPYFTGGKKTRRRKHKKSAKKNKTKHATTKTKTKTKTKIKTKTKTKIKKGRKNKTKRK